MQEEAASAETIYKTTELTEGVARDVADQPVRSSTASRY